MPIWRVRFSLRLFGIGGALARWFWRFCLDDVGHRSRSPDHCAREVGFPHSLGALYTRGDAVAGFSQVRRRRQSDGSGGYGDAHAVPALRRLIHLHPDGSFELELAYFRHHQKASICRGPTGANVWAGCTAMRCVNRLARPTCRAVHPTSDRKMSPRALALLEDAVVHIALGWRDGRGDATITCGWGCAQFGGQRQSSRSDAVSTAVCPARRRDNGTSIGAALWVAHQLLAALRRFVMHHAYTGPEFSDADCEQSLRTVLGDGAQLDAQGQVVVDAVETVGRDGQRRWAGCASSVWIRPICYRVQCRRSSAAT